ncbi:MAG: hemerythrin family protein [Gammaproteobacteria bacterium]|nr:hemerythrin family protein [Gammaproteobacteria bacterium]
MSESTSTTIDYAKLGNTLIDGLHEEFTTLLSKLSASSNEEFASAFADLIEHLEKHFTQEQELMAQYNDANLAEHKAQHDKTLAELRQFQKRVNAGRPTFARAYIKDKLPEWFKLHTITMDSALVQCINTKN